MTIFHDLLKHPKSSHCIVEDTITSSYGDVKEATRRALKILRERGVSAHSIVALQTDRDTASIVTLIALLEMGCSVLLTNSRWPQTMHAEAIQRVAARHIVTAASLNKIDINPTSHAGQRPSWATHPAVIVATSGSTGVPKLALLPLSSLLVNARTSAPACRLTPNDCWHLSLPLFHVGGLGILFRTLVTGSSLSLTHSLENTKRGPISHLSIVPTQLYRLLRDPSSHETLRRQKVILVGGAPIGPRVITQALELGLPVMTTYGLTEMGSAVTLASSRLIAEGHSISLGVPLPRREMKLSANGEVLTRGETLFAGYITHDGVSLPLVDGDWFPTGDIGRLLADGTLAILGRRDAQFISGGENIHPEMIENALTSLPDIIAACVVPLPDDEFGERPFAFVISEGASLDLNEIREPLRELIPSFALPIGVQEAPKELLTPTGKISRAMARAAVKR